MSTAEREARRAAAALRRGLCVQIATRYGAVALCPGYAAAHFLRRKRPDLAIFTPREWRELLGSTQEEIEAIVAFKRHLGCIMWAPKQTGGHNDAA